jgi:uncharacterized protein (TIGR00251 family)
MNSEPTSDLTSAVVQTADGVVIRVNVQPKARREQFIGMHGGRLKLAVTEPADKGKANEAVVRLVAAVLNLPASRVQLVRGDTSRHKDLLVRDLEAAEVCRLLAESLP